jgi:long-chain acyl-CoA synthetase
MYHLVSYTLPEMVEKGSAHFADRPALAMVGADPKSGGAGLSYADLEPRTRRVAVLLGLLGARPGDRVALVSENRPEWGIACLGISRAGCVAVPILVDFTAEQMSNILEHSGSRVVLASRRFAGKLGDAGVLGGRIVVAVEDLGLAAAPGGFAFPEAGAIDVASSSFVPPPIRADDLALIVYTSGTTGRSKGVMLTHRNLLSNAEGAGCFIRIKKSDRFLSILPLAHAYEFTIGFLIPLLAGAAVYYLDRPPSASALMPALAKVRPTIVLSVPLVLEKVYRSSVKPGLEKIGLYKYPAFRRILERIAGAKLMRAFGGRVRFFGLGGAPVAPDVESFLNRAGFPYSIGYGLTETAPLLAGNKPGRVKVHTTGLPTRGVELRVADPRPGSGEGEIQARGPNVTPGYYKDPERSAEIFTEEGWFRTGDLGVMDAEGRITVRGRLKTMILGASGENIYPEEIEAVLNASPLVEESLVYGDSSGLTALVRLERAVGEALARAEAGLGEAEDSAARLVERIRREANARLAAFSRLQAVRIQAEPFEKTPTQKIKRYLYPGRA